MTATGHSNLLFVQSFLVQKKIMTTKMITPQLEKVKVISFNPKPLVWKDFMIEGNPEGDYGDGEGPLFIFFNCYCG